MSKRPLRPKDRPIREALPDQLWSPEQLAEAAGKTCDDCAESIARWGKDFPDLKFEALHIAIGVQGGGWACDHVDWSDEDAARAYEALYGYEMRWRDRLRAENERLREALRAVDACLPDEPHVAHNAARTALASDEQEETS